MALFTPPGHRQAGTACPTAGVARSAGLSRTGMRPDRRELDLSPAGGDPSARICWSLSGGHACLIAGSLIVRRPAVIRRRGICWSLPGGHARLIAGSLTSCRLAVTHQTGALVATRRAQCARSLGHDVMLSRGRSPGRHLLGTVRRAQGACSPGERRFAGPGRTPAGLRRALPGGHRVPDRWRSVDSAGAVSPTATLWSQDRVSCPGRAGRQGQHMVGQRASQRAAYPGSGIERPVLSGRRGVLTCRGPVNRVAQWQDSDRCSEPGPRQGGRASAGGGRRRSGGGHGPGRDPVILARLRDLRTGSTWSVH